MLCVSLHPFSHFLLLNVIQGRRAVEESLYSFGRVTSYWKVYNTYIRRYQDGKQELGNLEPNNRCNSKISTTVSHYSPETPNIIMGISVGSISQWSLYLIGGLILVVSPLYTMLFSGPQVQQTNYESFEKVSTLVLPGDDIQCPEHLYKVNIISRAPLIIHIPNFLSPSERDEIKTDAEKGYKPSPVYHGAVEEIDPKVSASPSISATVYFVSKRSCS
jgi:hypothetical protein